MVKNPFKSHFDYNNQIVAIFSEFITLKGSLKVEDLKIIEFKIIAFFNSFYHVDL